MDRRTRFGIVALGLAAGLAGAAPPAMTAKEVMGKLNKGANAPVILLKRELLKASPDWPEIQAQTKEYASVAAALGEAKPPKGDAASWAKLTKEYSETAKAMDEAAQKKDKAAALASNTKLTNACTTCHKAHRGD
jgi:hypothetical protein